MGMIKRDFCLEVIEKYTFYLKKHRVFHFKDNTTEQNMYESRWQIHEIKIFLSKCITFICFRKSIRKSLIL